NVAAVTAGADWSLFVKTDGTVWGMGFNGRGELGVGDTAQHYTPVQAKGVLAASLARSPVATHSLAVAVQAPLVTSQPANATPALGATATFSVSATGDAPLGYQWLKNGATLYSGANVFNATTATLTITNASAPDAATYSVVVSNAYGS